MWAKGTYPDMHWTASCGGMRTSIGTAIKMKRAGYRKGSSDIFIFEAKGKYHGLHIEMKKEKGGTKSPEQIEWARKSNERNYLAVFCNGEEEAKEIVRKYMEEIKS